MMTVASGSHHHPGARTLVRSNGRTLLRSGLFVGGPLDLGRCCGLKSALRDGGRVQMRSMVTARLLPPLSRFLALAMLVWGGVCATAASYTILIPSGYSLIANQVDIGGNTLNEVFPSGPPGARIYKWDSVHCGWLVFTFDDVDLT